ncbi:MAG: hypothetical protein LBV08_09205 [Clostridiales bacterium]|jgi:UDP-N-acetylmuramyl pentapeptide synthase|nr:hypothetical protein [Clostridiales bacterium]
MIKIGIIGDGASVYIEKIIFTLLSLTGLKVHSVLDSDYGELGQYPSYDVLIVNIDPIRAEIIEKFNVLVLNAENNYVYQNKLVSCLGEDDFLVLNADQKDVFNNISAIKANLITCGFNQKACITTSSIINSEYDTVLVCIQRAFKSINNKYIGQQEFSVNITSFKDNSIFNILSAIACILICGVEIDSISD